MIERDAEIIGNDRVTAEIFLMTLRCDRIAADARPGQFVMIRVRRGADPLLRRPFSICGTGPGGILRILYRVVGRGTAILSRLPRGDRLPVLGPLGRGFDLTGENPSCILVAGGMGIAPLLFLAAAGSGALTFMAGFRSAAEQIPPDLFGPGPVEVLPATDDGSVGHHGPVTELLEQHLSAVKKNAAAVCSCGPLPMLQRVALLCRDRGVPCQVSLEAAMACGLGVCRGCAVRASRGEKETYYHVCRDGPVFDARTLYWEDL